MAWYSPMGDGVLLWNGPANTEPIVKPWDSSNAGRAGGAALTVTPADIWGGFNGLSATSKARLSALRVDPVSYFMANGVMVPNVDNAQSLANVAQWQGAIEQTPSFRGEGQGGIGSLVGMMASDLGPFIAISSALAGGFSWLQSAFPSLAPGAVGAETAASTIDLIDPANGLSGGLSSGAGSSGAGLSGSLADSSWLSAVPSLPTARAAAATLAGIRSLAGSITGGTSGATAASGLPAAVGSTTGATVALGEASSGASNDWLFVGALVLGGLAVLSYFGKT